MDKWEQFAMTDFCHNELKDILIFRDESWLYVWGRFRLRADRSKPCIWEFCIKQYTCSTC